MIASCRSSLCVLCFIPIVSCTDETPSDLAASSRLGLDPLFVITLQESDSAFTGRPNALAIDPSTGDFLVADAYGDRVFRYERSGALTATYGVRGAGPGEFLNAGRVVAALPGRTVAADDGRSTLNIYDSETGDFIEGVPFMGILGSLQQDPDSAHIVWLGLLSLEPNISIGRWDTRSNQIEYQGAVPVEYLESNPLAGIYNRSQVALVGRTLVSSFQGDDRLYRRTWDDVQVDTIRVPARLRASHPEDIVQSMAEEREFPNLLSMVPAVFGIYPVSRSAVAVVHFDQEMNGPAIDADVFLSVVNLDTRHVCVDLPIPLDSDVQPRVTMRGDTLFVVTQRVSDGTEAATLVTAFRLLHAECTAQRTLDDSVQ
jgi:hypothetical protein